MLKPDDLQRISAHAKGRNWVSHVVKVYERRWLRFSRNAMLGFSFSPEKCPTGVVEEREVV